MEAPGSQVLEERVRNCRAGDKKRKTRFLKRDEVISRKEQWALTSFTWYSLALSIWMGPCHLGLSTPSLFPAEGLSCKKNR